MNKTLGLSLTAILLTATHALPAHSSTNPRTNARIDENARQSVNRSVLSSDQNLNQDNSNQENLTQPFWLEAFNPIKHPSPPTDNPPESNGVISFVYDYQIQGKPVSTVYVQEIPVLTFLNQNAHANATQLSDRLNQLHRNNVDPETITAHWDQETKSYNINVGDQVLITINNNVILADTTQDPAQDTLQATNRLRRLLSDNTVGSLSQIEGLVQAQGQLQNSNLQVIQEITGVASWYGPGFNGRQSANGEIFNQNELTAAHKSLPFGTLVRVTNLNNGRSVIVRINDRGPYIGNRILDLSARAAQEIGMISTGVAPISLEILR